MDNVRQIVGTDIDQINEWYEKWGLPKVTPKSVPATGFIVPNIAAGTIYLTDSSVAMIDGYISNPAAPKQAVDEALDFITNKLMTHALVRGYTEFMVLTKNSSIEKRALSYGFKEVGTYKLLGKEVN